MNSLCLLVRLQHQGVVMLGICCLTGCATITPARPSISEYLLDVKGQKLVGYEQTKDQPLTFCQTEVCYVYLDVEVRRIKKYIVELEDQLKACQKE